VCQFTVFVTKNPEDRDKSLNQDVLKQSSWSREIHCHGVRRIYCISAEAKEEERQTNCILQIAWVIQTYHKQTL